MLRQLLFLLAAVSIAFPVTGAECPAVHEECIRDACIHAGGEINQMGYCEKAEKFDEARYSQELSSCEQVDEFCVENDGLVHNMSCCGPVTAFALVLLVLYADGRP